MAFTAPPNLPDYKKLKTILNQSGIQSSNSALFDILVKLIDAVGQSQDVVTKTLLPAISTLVHTDPAGALNGDGSTDNPLKVRVDGSTISINGSNNLQANFAGLVPQIVIVTLSQTDLGNIFGTPKTFIPAVAGKTLLLQELYARTTKNTNSWNNGGADYAVHYVGDTTSLHSATFPCGLNTATAGDCEAYAGQSNFSYNSNNAFHPKGKGLEITNTLGALTPVGAGAVASAVVVASYWQY